MCIPKIIHYCWFGGAPKTVSVQKCIANWNKIVPDYELREWNESNFDVGASCGYVKEACQKKKWAFVTDYVRLLALLQFGGIYLDTDVELIRPLDPLLSADAFIGAEGEHSICTAVIGARPDAAFIKRILRLYDGRRFIRPDGTLDKTPNSRLVYKMLADSDGYRTSGSPFQARDCVVYPAEYFSPLNFYTMKMTKTANTYSIHYYAGTWKTPAARVKDKLSVGVTRLIGEANREKLARQIKGRE